MKYIEQFGIILVVTFFGEVLHALIPLPVPASIYGLILMLVALKTKVIPLEKVKDGAKFLIDVMPLMFIPSAVGLIDAWGVLEPIWLQVSIVMVVSTVAVMIVSGRVTQRMIRKGRGEEK